ncbi:asparagine--tRNA ligase [Striga asiatica]|uniref:Asparagine--tRNA ligase n=1 Tax=Striga asiatica TaxID=4170 RepID=A0A5A7QFC0_STRAF|nr:asparagine--tRNA ligase [Striga asiatica]
MFPDPYHQCLTSNIEQMVIYELDFRILNIASDRDPIFLICPARKPQACRKITSDQSPDPIRRRIRIQLPNFPTLNLLLLNGIKERVLQELSRRPPLTRVTHQTPSEHVRGLVGQPARRLRQVSGERDSVQRRRRILHLRPRPGSGGHLDDRAAEGPHVRRETLLLAAGDLRRHVRGRAGEGVGTAVGHPPRAPEVGDFQAGVPDQDVLALDVAVGHPLLVEVAQPQQDLAAVRANRGFIERAAAFSDLIGERAAGNILQEQIEKVFAVFARCVGAQALDDVRGAEVGNQSFLFP